MDFKWITLIVIVAFYLCALLITGILALKYQTRHKTYKKVEASLKSLLEKAEIDFKEIDFDLLSVETEFDLPKNETLKLQNEYVYGVKEDKLKKKKNQDDDVLVEKKVLKENYSLKNVRFKTWDFEGQMFLTNLRMMLKNQAGFLQIPLKEITNVKPSVFNINGNYQIGLLLITNNCNYKLITEELVLFFYFKTMLDF